MRLTIPRRAYSSEHLDYVADTVLRVFALRDEIPGLELVYEPPTLRFFQARFEPLCPVPSFGAVRSDAETRRGLDRQR